MTKDSSMLIKLTKPNRDQITADAKACGMDRTDYMLRMHKHFRGDMYEKFKDPDAGKPKKKGGK